MKAKLSAKNVIKAKLNVSGPVVYAPDRNEIDNYTIKRNSAGKIYVNTTTDCEEDLTLPVSSAGMYNVVGNINAILTII